MQDWKDILYEKTKHKPVKFKHMPYWIVKKKLHGEITGKKAIRIKIKNQKQ